MRVARFDYYQQGRQPERGPDFPRHQLTLDDEIAYFKRYERLESVDLLPSSFPVLARAVLHLEGQPPLTIVMRDCGSY